MSDRPTAEECDDCNGFGTVNSLNYDEPCRVCGGSGRVTPNDDEAGYDPQFAELQRLRDTIERLRVADTAARAALDAIDHATYGWSFATAVPMVDKIRLIARETLAAAAALQEPQPAKGEK